MQSLFNKSHILEAFIQENPKEYQAICITESWLSKDKLDLLNYSGYNLAASYCRTNYEGGGVCILLQDDLEYVERQDIMDLSVEYVIEVCAVEITRLNILLLAIYWNGRETEIFYNQLKLILNLMTNKYKKFKILIGGDFNVNILVKNRQNNLFLDFFLQYNFNQHIKEPTRVTSTSSTCLDLIFTNFVENCDSNVKDFGFSDHKSVCIKVKNLRGEYKTII